MIVGAGVDRSLIEKENLSQSPTIESLTSSIDLSTIGFILSGVMIVYTPGKYTQVENQYPSLYNLLQSTNIFSYLGISLVFWRVLQVTGYIRSLGQVAEVESLGKSD